MRALKSMQRTARLTDPSRTRKTGSAIRLARVGIDVGDPEAVDAAHAEDVRRGLRVVYPLTVERWCVRRLLPRGSQWP
jgi:hypothetical protein